MNQPFLVVLTVGLAAAAAQSADHPWKLHIVDNTSQGADGVRLADVNGDGLQDITTGWEQGNIVRVYLNPGPAKAAKPWPAVTVGSVPAPEDAVFADLDQDGSMDVVSSTEGGSKKVFIHWAPKDRSRYLDESAWETAALPASIDTQQWMYVLPLDADGANGIDLVAGSKNLGGSVGWFRSPPDPRRLDQWQWKKFYGAGWIMSLIDRDMDGDGDLDVLASDRRGVGRGALWFERPLWGQHRIGAVNEYEAMFLKPGDLDGDGLEDIVVAARLGGLYVYRRLDSTGDRWETSRIEMPSGIGTNKATAIADLDLDGDPDIAFTCERAHGDLHGVGWLSQPGWDFHPISGPLGVKFDRIELIDLDGDGDLDLLTCEEIENLGVIWYENPAR